MAGGQQGGGTWSPAAATPCFPALPNGFIPGQGSSQPRAALRVVQGAAEQIADCRFPSHLLAPPVSARVNQQQLHRVGPAPGGNLHIQAGIKQLLQQLSTELTPLQDTLSVGSQNVWGAGT